MASVEFLIRRGAAAAQGLGFHTGLVLASVMALGCSEMDPGTDTFELLSNAPSDDVPPTADWSCVGDAPTGAPPNLPDEVTYEFPLVEWVSDIPIPGRSVKVCNKVNPACDQPVVGTNVEISPEDRFVRVTMRTGINAFLEIGATPEYVPETLWLDGPMYSDQTGGRIQLLSLQTVGSLAASIQLPLDPTFSTGILAIRAHDCTGRIASGAIYEISAAGMAASNVFPYTFVNGSARGEPVPGVRTTIPSDATPWAGFINVQPGQLTVRGYLADTMEEFGSAEIFVRPGYLAAVEIRPLDHL